MPHGHTPKHWLHHLLTGHLTALSLYFTLPDPPTKTYVSDPLVARGLEIAVPFLVLYLLFEFISALGVAEAPDSNLLVKSYGYSSAFIVLVS